MLWKFYNFYKRQIILAIRIIVVHRSLTPTEKERNLHRQPYKKHHLWEISSNWIERWSVKPEVLSSNLRFPAKIKRIVVSIKPYKVCRIVQTSNKMCDRGLEYLV